MMTDDERRHLEDVKRNGGMCDLYGTYCSKRCLIYKEAFAPQKYHKCPHDTALEVATKLLLLDEDGSFGKGVCESIW